MTTTQCPHCGKPLNVASLLGHLAKGHRKRFSKAELAIRTARLAEARELWRKKLYEKMFYT